MPPFVVFYFFPCPFRLMASSHMHSPTTRAKIPAVIFCGLRDGLVVVEVVVEVEGTIASRGSTTPMAETTTTTIGVIMRI